MWSNYILMVIVFVLCQNGLIIGQDDPAAEPTPPPETTTAADDSTGIDTSTVEGSDTADVGETTVEGETTTTGPDTSTDAGAGETTSEGTGDTSSTAGDSTTVTPSESTTSGGDSTTTVEKAVVPSTEETTSTGGETSPSGDDTSITPGEQTPSTTKGGTEAVAPTPGTDDTTTVKPASATDEIFVKEEELTEEQRINSLTLELDISEADINWDNEQEVAEFYAWLQQVIADLLNKNQNNRKRRAVDTQTTYKPGDVKFVGKHQIKNGKLILSVTVKKPGSKDASPSPIPKENLDAIKNKLKEILKTEKKIATVKVYSGVAAPVTGAVSDNTGGSYGDENTVFNSHLGIFLVLIIVSILCIISFIVGAILIKCRGRTAKKKNPRKMEEGKKLYGGEIESPISDEDIMKDEAPMIEKGNPALNGDFMNKGEEGWVVPIDELNKDERLKPEVEDTKL